MFAGAAEAARAALAGIEIVDNVKADLQHRHDHQLRQPIHRIQGKFRLAAVPGGNHQLALVIRVDKPDQVPQNDSVLMPQTATWQDHRRIAGIAYMDGQAGWDQVSFAGLERQWGVQAGPQIETGTAFGRIGRQLFLHARVENFYVNFFHG